MLQGVTFGRASSGDSFACTPNLDERLRRLPTWVVVIVVLPAATVLGIEVSEFASGGAWRVVVQQLIDFGVLLAGCAWVLHRSGVCSMALRGPLDVRSSWATAVAAGLCVQVLAFSVLLLALAFGPVGQVPPHTLEASTLQHPGASAVQALVLVVLAPVAEELAFRGVLFRAWRARWGGVWAALASSALFALLHPTHQATFFVAGIVFTVLYVKTGSLAASALAHGFNNALAVLVAHGLNHYSSSFAGPDADRAQVVDLPASSSQPPAFVGWIALGCALCTLIWIAGFLRRHWYQLAGR